MFIGGSAIAYRATGAGPTAQCTTSRSEPPRRDAVGLTAMCTPSCAGTHRPERRAAVTQLTLPPAAMAAKTSGSALAPTSQLLRTRCTPASTASAIARPENPRARASAVCATPPRCSSHLITCCADATASECPVRHRHPPQGSTMWTARSYPRVGRSRRRRREAASAGDDPGVGRGVRIRPTGAPSPT